MTLQTLHVAFVGLKPHVQHPKSHGFFLDGQVTPSSYHAQQNLPRLRSQEISGVGPPEMVHLAVQGLFAQLDDHLAVTLHLLQELQPEGRNPWGTAGFYFT